VQPPILHFSLREQIADLIRADVLTGRLGAGAQLKEAELARRYTVSRGPVRDALLQLSKEGILAAKPNCGVTVRAPVSSSQRSLLIKLRQEIECHALGRIFSEIEAEDIAFWQSNLCAFEAACGSGAMEMVVRLDMEFHRSIVERQGGEALAAVWLPIVAPLNLPYSRHAHLLESFEEHRAIVAAIVAKDRRAAIRHLKTNIQ
jgi:GntR family transcriptional regulator, rspAB operon transcriptional repressor